MMICKAKLEISRSSTIVLKEIFVKSPRIRSYRIAKSRCQSSIVGLKLVGAARVVADRPQAVATVWQ